MKTSKCEFMVPSVQYLGHRIDAQGLHPLQEKVRAIVEAPAPTCVKSLRAYLGLITASFSPTCLQPWPQYITY